MNDSISRKQALEEMTFSEGIEKDGVLYVPLRDVKKHIKNLPPVQHEIIRCSDCVYSHMTYSGECKYCDMWRQIYESGESLYLEGDFFCGFGERKTDD